jgi:zinc protease
VTYRMILLLSGLLLAAVPLAAQAAEPGDIFPFKVHEATLENGLEVVVIPYDSPGIVSYQTVVRTGSRDEVEAGHSGFAHFFEHMMFRGTERYPKDLYADTQKRMGADSNAYTSDDETVYYIVGPASELPTIMDMEADRFQNLKYSEDDFRTEALAVLGEYNKNASNPFRALFEELRDKAYTQHTYKHTTMGFLADIKAMPGYYDYSLRFFDRYYRPENVSVVIVGDVQPQQVFELAKKHYGGWEKGYKAPAVQAEPPQKGAKEGTIAWPNPIRPHVMIGYHAPAFDTSKVDWATLDLVGQLLFSESAPLYQELVVDKQWVDFIGGGIDPHRDPYLFTVITRVKSDELVPKVLETVQRHIDQIQAEPVDPQRLERIKSHLRYAFSLGLDTPGDVAGAAANAIVLTGSADAFNQLYRQYDKVQPKDVQRMAKATFRPETRTLVTLSHQAAKPQGEAAQSSKEDGR